MVVIGHSQGGLLTKMMVVDSGDRFWNNVTSVPFDKAELDPETRDLASRTMFFKPLPFVTRVLSVVVASLGGFGFAVYKFKGKEIIFTIMLATLMIPLVVSVIPYFYVMKTIGWFDKARSLYLPAMASSYGVFLMRKYIESAFPRDLLDAARIDGCGEFGIYYKIVLPVILPGLAALGIISFISSWRRSRNGRPATPVLSTRIPR